MDNWSRFYETSLPDKNEFYRNLNMKDITGADFKHTKRELKEFQIKNLGEHHDLYLQSTLLLADTSERFHRRCTLFISTGVVWQKCLKKTKIELELLTDVDMLLKIEK